MAITNHDHSGDPTDGGQFDVSNLTSGAALIGQIPMADGIGGVGWGNESIDTPPTVPNAVDDEFAAGSLNGKWTNVNSTGIAFVDSVMVMTLGAAADAVFRQAFAPGASAAFTITAKFVGVSLWQHIDFIGINVLKSDNTVISDIGVRWQTNINDKHPILYIGSGGERTIIMPIRQSTFYLRLSRDASDVYTAYYSPDGRSWVNPLATHTLNTAVAKVSISFGSTAPATWKKAGIDWIRRT